MKYILETIAFNIHSCTLAQAAGANRVELCDNPSEGGTTASYGFIKTARQVLKIDLFPIIRPRGGDFLYNNAEFEIMKTDIQVCKDLGCNGVVFGLLDSDATIDKVRCKILVQLAYPMSATFHRAFDRVTDPPQALEDIIGCGFERILTSGYHPTAIEGLDNLKKLIQVADDRIIIMPGSGVRSSNIGQLARVTNAVEFHSSARKMENSSMKLFNENMKENLQSVAIDEEEIKSIIEILSQLQHEDFHK
ncbi:MAG: copper homeostasis protein CutC [Ferruginibacter sp.]